MQDERILSARERELVSSLLHHADTATQKDRETREAVRAAIASAVGETVAQRAFSVLGSSIVERILAGGAAAQSEKGAHGEAAYEYQAVKPTPAAPGPQPPSKPLRAPAVTPPGPQPPSVQPLKTPPAPGPQPPSASVKTTVVSHSAVAVAERPRNLPAQCVVLDEFLSPQEVEDLTRFTLEHKAEFAASEVVSLTSDRGVVNDDHRRSRVLTNLGTHEELVLERIRTVLPEVLEKLGMEPFAIAGAETQVTASNDGDFFHFHSDNGDVQVASRHLTFVYFFHREPRKFEGGELRIHDSHLEDGSYVSDGSYQTIVPRQNQIVFFPCEMMHEITPVQCGSGEFADSRFTLNGWLRR